MAVAWVALDEAALLGSMTSREREQFGRISATAGTPDRAVNVLADTVAEVRGMIESAELLDRVDVDRNKIPPSMRGRALALARWALLCTVPGYEPGEARRTEYLEARRYFEKVATGAIKPEPSDNPTANPTLPAIPHSNAEVISGVPEKITGREELRGL